MKKIINSKIFNLDIVNIKYPYPFEKLSSENYTDYLPIDKPQTIKTNLTFEI